MNKSVDRGAALLDERLPGWRGQVQPDALHLQYGCNCVLGQLFGSYDKGIEALQVDPVEYGFYKNPRGRWDRLTDAWKRVLA